MSKISFQAGGGIPGHTHDHGGLGGLADNDHTQYVLTSGNKTDPTNQEVHHLHFLQDPQDIQHSGGAVHWDFDNDTLSIHPFADPSVELQVGQELYIKAVNKTGSGINNGQPVKIGGAQGNRPIVLLAQADCACAAAELIGLATQDIADNAEGFITIVGNVNDVDTSMWSVGDSLWLDPNVAGGFINFKPPVESGWNVHIGEVLTAHANQGRILLHGVDTNHVEPNIYNQITTQSGIRVAGLAAGANVIPSGSGFASIGTPELAFSSGVFDQVVISGEKVGDFLSREHQWQANLTTFIEASTKNTLESMHGGYTFLDTGAAVSNGSPFTMSTKGTGKVAIGILAGADTTGTLTLTGRSIDRNTGAEVEGDTDTMAIAGLSTDNSTTDGGGHDVLAWRDVYLSSKWFIGGVTISTVDANLSDFSAGHVSFEQFNDVANYTLTTFDISTQAIGFTDGELYSHLYKVQKQQDGRFTVSGIADLSVEAGSGVADAQYRLRKGNLGVRMSGATDGIFVETYFDNRAWLYTTTKVWANCRDTLAF